jgi:uncharacterized protein YndB with AHSA1/START domain
MESLAVISWPEKYRPERTAVHVRNELEMSVRPETVWAWLVRADLWPTWYRNSEKVAIEGGGHELGPDSRFRWRTFGVTLESMVTEYRPRERLAWNARSMGVDAYHAWLIEERPYGCYVLTEENQNGWLARLSNQLRPQNMHKQHQDWLNGLLRKAKEGAPPSPEQKV